jgi:DNA-binding winged helix-turn-helix (wHTH) protein
VPASPPIGDAAGPVRFLDVVFGSDFLTATRDDGEVVRLSRRERALLLALVSHPQRLMTRAQLLEAMAADDEEVSDRKVDVVVTRLRHKLKDPARTPRFIATQYGEGYLWIAAPQPAPASPGFLVIGPVRGAGGAKPEGHRLLEALREALAARAAPSQTVALRPDWRPAPDAPGFRFSLEVDFVGRGRERAAALVLRDEVARQVVESRRLELSQGPDPAALATELAAAIWRHLAGGRGAAATPADEPLHIRMQDAALLLGPAQDPWSENERRLRLARARDPADPAAALMWAIEIYARRIREPAPAESVAEAWGRTDAEIRTIVTGCLPRLKAEPILALAAARLLAGSGGSLARAEALARDAMRASPAFGAGLPVLAQLCGWRGDLTAALAGIDEVRALAVPGSEFEVYLLVMRSQMLRAGGGFAAAKAQDAELFRIKPSAEGELGLIMLLPGEEGLTTRSRRWLAAVEEGAARRLINHEFYLAARHFRRLPHRRNLMLGLTDHLGRRFGPSIVPEAIRRALRGKPNTGATMLG